MKKLAAIAAAAGVVSFSAMAMLLTVGDMSLVRTHGISMQPAYYAGDLALTAGRSGGYAIGDVAAYRSEQMDTLVLHRIIGIEDGRVSLQGDNNSWVDPEQPSQDQLLGEVVLRVPGGAIWLQRATSPAALGATAFLVLISGGSAMTVTRRQRRKRRRASALPVAAPAPHAMPAGSRIALALAAVVGLIAGCLGVATWTRPVGGAAMAGAEAPSALTFSYSAEVPASPAYDKTLVTQPQPVFRRLADRVEVAFVYDAAAPDPTSSWTAAVELATANGWQSRFTVPVEVTESGVQQKGHIILDLPALAARADAAARAIAAEAAGDISITVLPELQSQGEPFRPKLAFVMTATALRLLDEKPSALRVENPHAATMASASTEPATLPLLGHSLRVDHGRAAAVAGLAVAVAVAGLVALLARRARRRPETSAIQGRYRQILLRAQPMVLPAGRPVVDVLDFAALARLAARYGLLVLHWDRGGISTYVVLDDSTTYRYRTGGAVADAPNAEVRSPPAAAMTTPSQLP